MRCYTNRPLGIINGLVISMSLILLWSYSNYPGQTKKSYSNQTSSQLLPIPSETGPVDFAPVDTWQAISKTCFVFNAYLDNRRPVRWIRIVAIRLREIKDKRPIKCHMYFSGSDKPQVVTVHQQINIEHHNTMYSAYLFSCKIPANFANDPYAVKLNQGSTDKKTKMIRVQRTYRRLYNYTVCVPTMNNYSNHQQVVDFIETNRMFGANHFVIYNTTSYGLIRKYLNNYIRQKIVTFIQWDLPVSTTKIHYFGQLATVTDCLYRSISRSKYIAFIDFDEVIVPRKAPNWDLMLQNVQRPKSHKKGGYLFLCNFHQPCENTTSTGPNLPLHLKKKAEELGINSVLLQTADDEIHVVGKRSKVIVDSDAVTMMGVHGIWEYLPGYGNVVVHTSVGLLHHYRLFGGCNITHMDTYMDRFAEVIVTRVQHVHDRVNLVG